VIPATIAVESERIAPGKIVHRSPFILLSTTAKGQEHLAPTLQILRHFGFECLIVDEEATLMWSKLVFLAPVALSTAAACATIGDVLSDSVRAAQLEKCVQEACAVAARAGARVDADAVLGRIKTLPPTMRSSMEKDIANGNPLELDAIAGPILSGAARHNVQLQATSELVREIMI
jgi:2-dehydropantoate 2-reductase